MTTKSKSERIRALLNTGMTARQIATKVKCNPQLVYTVRWHANKKAGIAALEVAPARKGRPAKAKAKGTGVELPPGRTIPEMQDEARKLSEQAQDVAQWAKDVAQQSKESFLQAEYRGAMLSGGYTMPIAPHPAQQSQYMQNYPTGDRGALYNTMAVPREAIREFTPQRRGLWERVKDFFRG